MLNDFLIFRIPLVHVVMASERKQQVVQKQFLLQKTIFSEESSFEKCLGCTDGQLLHFKLSGYT